MFLAVSGKIIFWLRMNISSRT